MKQLRNLLLSSKAGNMINIEKTYAKFVDLDLSRTDEPTGF